jgi:hypothetical protein
MPCVVSLQRIQGIERRVSGMRGIRVFLSVLPVLAATVLVGALPVQASSPLVPAIAVPVSHPAAPLAGKEFEITFPVLNAMTGARLTNVTSISFEPTIAGKAVQLQQTSFVAGYRAVAGVVWMTIVVPARSEGQVLKVKVTIKAGGLNASRIESYHIGKSAL